MDALGLLLALVLALLGWAGAALYLGAFAAVSSGLLPRSPRYFRANLVAAAAVALSSAALGSWQAAAVNAVWALLSAGALAGRRVPVPPWVPRAVHGAVAALLAAALWQGLAGGTPAATEILAWISLVGFAYSYLAFASFGMGPTAFQAWNLGSALALIPQVLLDANHPVLVIETLWATVALYGLLRPVARPTRVPA